MTIDFKPREDEATSWLWVGLWLLFIYISIPLARTVQEYVRALGAASAFAWITIAVLGVAGAWITIAAFRGRLHLGFGRAVFLVLIAICFTGMTWQLRANPEEAFHFVQYGVLGLLIFRALRQRFSDPSIYLLALMIGAAAGIVDEWIQWIVPRRFFDLRDIGLNCLAVLLVLSALAFGLQPVPMRQPFNSRGLQLFCVLGIFNALCFVFIFSNTPKLWDLYKKEFEWHSAVNETMAEFGYRMHDPELGIFFTRINPGNIASEDAARGKDVALVLNEYRRPHAYRRFLRKYPPYEDPFMAEARMRIDYRDHFARMVRQDDLKPSRRQRAITIAWHENRFLEKYFSNTVGQSIYRWPPEVAAAFSSNPDNRSPYVSGFSSHLITRFSQRTALLLLASVVAILVFLERRISRRSAQR